MGAALADAAAELGFETVFIHGPVERSVMDGKPYRCIGVDTTIEMHDAVVRELRDRTILVMAAAPADWAPAVREDRKIKKTDEAITLRLVKTIDILKSIAAKRSAELSALSLFIAGFAAETHDIESYAAGKLEQKNLDMICVNDVSKEGAGFGVDTNELVVLCRGGERVEIAHTDKLSAARRIVALIAERIDF
jgi:phosphopantothenoylcysteine decarboxylase/phosphopantothenate--cysteine ligase